MALQTREVEVVVCDSCGEDAILTEGLPEGWFGGSVTLGTENGTASADWNACKPAHIKQAVINVLEA